MKNAEWHLNINKLLCNANKNLGLCKNKNKSVIILIPFIEIAIYSMCLLQALKHLRSIQVINFGDCLVRPAGAIAIAESVSEGLPILKVTFCYLSD